MKEVVIIDAARTPVGKYKGSLRGLSAAQLGTVVTKGLLNRVAVSADQIDQVIFGNVLQGGSGQNVARQVAIESGIPETVPAMTVNEVCGSGLKALVLARQLIQLGEAEVVLAGGTESMSQAPLVKPYDPETNDYGEPISSMICDGLTDAFSKTHMGLTVEKLAETYEISRDAQDRFSLASHQKAAKAVKAGKFDKEMISVTENGEVLLAKDEGIRENSTLEKLGALKTVFLPEGSITAGNASTLNDGASAILLASKDYAEAHQLPYLAVIRDYAEIGTAPADMGISPIFAIRKLLAKTGVEAEQIDLFEINEAFAASSLIVEQELGLEKERVNIYGGGVSLGHPIGASGARIITTLVHALIQEDKKLGVASLCIGGGLGLAMLIERT
ncbi:thiolase family protein [Listeria costaricensis]|uniref:thiolase family protein n=1 Tax=Listeria costaricensis TaxID=2026604 RepID=UPI000C075076|nr:thiolase family protein [Listeria costaricensis]